MPRDYRLFVNDERTVLVRIWDAPDGREPFVEVCRRDAVDEIWGPPVIVKEER